MVFICQTDNLKDYLGYFTASPTHDYENGQLLVAINQEINEKLIDRLLKRDIDAIEISKEKIDEKTIVAETDLQSKIAAKRTKKHLVEAMGKVIDEISQEKKFKKINKTLSNETIKRVHSTIEKVLGLLTTNKTSALYLSMTNEKDQYLLNHSANVAYLSLCLVQRSAEMKNMLRCKERGLPKFTPPKLSCDFSDFVPLGVACMLHDIGKLFMLDIIQADKKYEKADEVWDRIKEHPKLGHDILFGKNISPHALLGIKYHHEDWDGSGYPYGIEGTKIHVFSRIIRIADTFDAATTLNQAGRSGKTPEETISEMKSLSEKHYDKEILDEFILMIQEDLNK